MFSFQMHKTAVFVCVHLFVQHLLYSEASDPEIIPRRTIKYQDATLKVFAAKGLSNFSSMLLSEKYSLVIVGARDAILALDINNVSRVITKETWEARKETRKTCVLKEKSQENDCRNYIVGLNRVNEDKIYVCGTHAFYPQCDYMTIGVGKIELKRLPQHNKLNTVYDPEYSHASIMVDGVLYSAAQSNFRGTEPVFYRNLNQNSLRTKYSSQWLRHPNFVYVDVVRESQDSPERDDDKIYLFFSETVEGLDFKSEIVTSRVARVCKGDQGGKRILQKKWSTFLKAGLECKSHHSDNTFNVIQDVYLFKESKWRDNIFYAIFTLQWGLQDNSAVCAFTMAAIEQVFNKGTFKTPEILQNGYHHMIRYTGNIPVPRPGTCINKSQIKSGYRSSLDMPDKTLQFTQNHPLLDDIVMPKDNNPMLVKHNTKYTQIVVQRVTAINQKQYIVIFLGTAKGCLHKAMNIAGKGYIIEEVQIFPSEEPVKILRISPTRGQLYVGSQSQIVQVPVAVCSQYKTCWNCVLAKDPHCVWNNLTGQCFTIITNKGNSENWIQDVENGDVSKCPIPKKSSIDYQLVTQRNKEWLKCQVTSNLAQKEWQFKGKKLPTNSSKYIHHKQGLLILNLSKLDKGRYDCQVAEMVNGKQLTYILETYNL